MANKSTTIKNATDQELDALLVRLRKESEAQNIISSIKRQSSGTYDYYNSNENAVSTEIPIEDLYHDEEVEEVLAHFGIKGMHWGHKKGTSVDLHAKRQAKMKKQFKDKTFADMFVPTQKLKNKFNTKSENRRQKKLDTQSDEYKQSRELKAKSYKTLSNKELKALNERMQLERNLRDLKSSDLQKGLDIVKTITAGGTTIAGLYALSTTPLGQAVKKAITKK